LKQPVRPLPENQGAFLGEISCVIFEITSKRRKGFPSETHVKRGQRVVHGDKELLEKLGRNDLCPCNSGRLFQTLLPEIRLLLMG